MEKNVLVMNEVSLDDLESFNVRCRLLTILGKQPHSSHVFLNITHDSDIV